MHPPSKPPGSFELAPTDPEFPIFSKDGVPGQLLAGKYVLEQEIGRGGMGVVWRAAWPACPDAHVAVKLMTRVDTPVARARFEREAALMALLRSPHVVQVFEHGVDERTGAPFIVMELLEGESLAKRLERLEALSPGEVAMLVDHVAMALSRAQKAGIIHRDLKPDNIFIVRDDHDQPIAKVLDFGLAKPVDSMLDSRAVTIQGHTVGTFGYMSPEQSQGATPDHTGDLWSLAVIAYECLLGQRPFHANDVRSLTLQLWSEKRPVPSDFGEVPPGFDAWFAKATHLDVEQRFQTAREFADALLEVCGSAPGDMPPLEFQRRPVPQAISLAPVTAPPEPRSFFHRRLAIAMSLMVGLLGGLAGSAYFGHSKATLPATSATGAPPRAVEPAAVPPSQQSLVAPLLPMVPSTSTTTAVAEALPPASAPEPLQASTPAPTTRRSSRGAKRSPAVSAARRHHAAEHGPQPVTDDDVEHLRTEF